MTIVDDYEQKQEYNSREGSLSLPEDGDKMKRFFESQEAPKTEEQMYKFPDMPSADYVISLTNNRIPGRSTDSPVTNPTPRETNYDSSEVKPKPPPMSTREQVNVSTTTGMSVMSA